MKKFLLVLLTASTLISCDVNDDGPNLVTVSAEVVAVDLPEFFEEGEKYDVEVTYLLPDACHLPAGILVQRGSEMGNGRRDIYVFAGATVEYGTECNEEPKPKPTTEEEEANPLEKKGSFELLIDEEEPYTFYLWTGTDEDGEAIFDEVVVPVGEQEPVEQ